MIVLIRDLRPKSVSAWIAQNAERKSPRQEGARPSAAWSRSASARRSCADLGVTRHGAADQCAAVALRGPRRPSGCASSASAGSSERHGRPDQAIHRGGQSASERTAGGQGAHVLIIEAPYYEAISDELAAGAIAELEAARRTYERITVPGALEIPQALAQAVKAGADRLGRRRAPASTAAWRSAASSAARPRTTTSSATTPITG